ncbi:hypothetical protein M409DRAFT_71411 [Zasmidium cellare ATCC 36951]|uniref:NAD(P)-binding domain-containing protein n=1 Tax=Zasmidium cellare ATCC 36951 TaxID=1080233 RepID=A0A6A6BY35_ZASCE|nr:uncharacterized protein M409DRAFT_71411 [Zasmidium cellare ATCC 36951]KAF2158850.1 hypothetical protein M409DRAFT_71411 [Zasmidium cellare ATCC 36951]
MADVPKTIAFFGATGDCASYCLARALQAGYTCTALARTPSKLTASLNAKHVRSSDLDTYLTIIHGDAKDPIAVKKALTAPSGGMVSYIVSGVGSTPKFQWNLWYPITLEDPTICQDIGKTILAAATELANDTSTPAPQRPFLLNVSTTGIPAKGCPRDVPLLFYPFYMYGLHATHVDKSILEAAFAAHINKAEKERGIRAFVNVKPSLLLDGEGRGLGGVREGPEDAPAVGYTIQRADVGKWMFERGLKEGLRSEYVNRSVTITY